MGIWYISNISQVYHRYISAIFWIYHTSGISPRHTLSKSQTYLQDISGTSWVYQRYISGVSHVDPCYISSISQAHPRHISSVSQVNIRYFSSLS